MAAVFTRIFSVTVSSPLATDPATGKNPAFEVAFDTDGDVPFPQVVIWEGGRQILVNGDAIRRAADPESGRARYIASVPAGALGPGGYDVQAEGCRTADLPRASAADWIKQYAAIRIESPRAAPRIDVGESPRPASAASGGVKIYFSIHKHMHQPYYDAVNLSAWDGQKDEIFGSRGGPYTHFVPAAARQYADGGLPHAGLSTSWSGSLIEQLNRCGRDGLCGGRFRDWNRALRDCAGLTTALGHPRVDFAAFGFYHPLMALIPARDIVRQIEWHRGIVRDAFGIEASRILFPPETAFHVRMIPALRAAGIEATIYDSIHRFRSCKNYPYAGPPEGMLPPNPAEQENPPASDWLQLHNIWAGSKIAPSLLRPECVKYEHIDGTIETIVAVPAERYIGNEDARGGFGALQYPDVLGQVRDSLIASGSYDPAHPPFFILHSDGDNHGGGADSYYTSNTGALVHWLKGDPRFELTSIRDYLRRFPPDPARAVHLEPGSWSGADNGDPQFRKWFSRYTEPYSPDLNSWAVLTAFQNAVHTVEDAEPNCGALGEATRLLLTAETSCYWYWTGQDIWDAQVTNAANRGRELLRGAADGIVSGGRDRTGPTIFAPWVTPENPGGKTWGNNCLLDAAKEGTVHTFIADVSGVKRAALVLRTATGEATIPLRDNGPYPSKTGAAVTAGYYTATLPAGAGDVRYFIEAEDGRGNVSRSALERVFLA